MPTRNHIKVGWILARPHTIIKPTTGFKASDISVGFGSYAIETRMASEKEKKMYCICTPLVEVWRWRLGFLMPFLCALYDWLCAVWFFDLAISLLLRLLLHLQIQQTADVRSDCGFNEIEREKGRGKKKRTSWVDPSDGADASLVLGFRQTNGLAIYSYAHFSRIYLYALQGGPCRPCSRPTMPLSRQKCMR